MAVLDNAAITQQLAATTIPTEVPPVLKAYLWSWYDQNKGRVVFKKWFFNITIEQCQPIFVMLLGPEPTGGV